MNLAGKLVSAIALSIVMARCAPVVERPADPVRPDGPLSIPAAIALALKNNPDVLVAEQRVGQAQAVIDEASSDYWPVLRLTEVFSQTDAPSEAFGHILDQRRFKSTLDFNDPGVTRNFRTGLTGSITLYDGGRRRARLMGAEARAVSAAARAQAVRRDIAFEVARAFYLVHKASDTAAAQEESLESLSTHLRIAEARLSEGAARRSDVLAVQVRIAETREAVVTARSAAVRAEAGLQILLGLSVAEPLELEEPPADDVPALEDLETLIARARAHRFELIEAEGQVRSSHARLKEAWAGYFPDITVFGGFGFDDRDFALTHSNWTWGISIVEDLFDALRTPYRVRQALADLKAVYASFRKTLLEIELDVKNATLDAEEATARFDVAQEATRLAEELRRRVEVEYEEGAADVTRLLDAELALTLARTRLRVAGHDRALSRIAISHAVGDYPAPPDELALSEARKHVDVDGDSPGGVE